ncbi:hypothetical protein HRED_08051 [Candidatus Haloredivivus sp. G17]|nr:hypothetical protein HRED_08051 [Candidatus Haloredivivus sp. G17]
MKENKKKLNKIEEAIRPEGGIQPSKKGLKILDKEENSQDLFTDVGKDKHHSWNIDHSHYGFFSHT